MLLLASKISKFTVFPDRKCSSPYTLSGTLVWLCLSLDLLDLGVWILVDKFNIE